MFCCIYFFIYSRTVVTVGEKKNVFEDVPADETPLMRIVHNYRSPPAINNPLVCILHKQKQTQTTRGGWTLRKVFISGEVTALYFLYSVTNNTKLSREMKVSPPSLPSHENFWAPSPLRSLCLLNCTSLSDASQHIWYIDKFPLSVFSSWLFPWNVREKGGDRHRRQAKSKLLFPDGLFPHWMTGEIYLISYKTSSGPWQLFREKTLDLQTASGKHILEMQCLCCSENDASIAQSCLFSLLTVLLLFFFVFGSRNATALRKKDLFDLCPITWGSKRDLFDVKLCPPSVRIWHESNLFSQRMVHQRGWKRKRSKK